MSEKFLMINTLSSFISLNVMGGQLKLPSTGTVAQMSEDISNFLTELFEIQGVKEVFEKYGASFEKHDYCPKK